MDLCLKKKNSQFWALCILAISRTLRLESFTGAKDKNLGKLWEMVRDMEAWSAAHYSPLLYSQFSATLGPVHGIEYVGELPEYIPFLW